MKKLAFWLMTVVTVSLPVPVFGQATGGSTCTKVKEAGTGRKGRVKTRKAHPKTTAKQTGSKSTSKDPGGNK